MHFKHTKPDSIALKIKNPLSLVLPQEDYHCPCICPELLRSGLFELLNYSLNIPAKKTFVKKIL